MSGDELDISVVAVDGHDAVAAIVIRRIDGGFSVTASADGITKPQAARLLLEIAQKWAVQ